MAESSVVLTGPEFFELEREKFAWWMRRMGENFKIGKVIENGVLLSSIKRRTRQVPSPPTGLGTLLPPRLPESLGSVFNVATKSEFTSALNGVPNGSIINWTASLDWGNVQYNIDRQASALAPITITSSPGVQMLNNFMWYLPQAKYLRFRGLEFTGGQDSIKPGSSPTSDIEIDRCYIHNQAGQGFYNASGCDAIYIWNTIFHNNGDETNLDHNMYIAYSSPTRPVVIANCLGYDPWAYNIQLYPNVKNMIVTCCTMDGYTSQPDQRGGMVIGSQGTATASGNTIVGLIGTNAAYYCIKMNLPLLGGNAAYDCLGFGNGAGDFDTSAGANFTFVNCSHADPMYVNRPAKNFHVASNSPAKNKVQPARYGYVPAFDIEGNQRLTADAGCYRVV